MRKFLVPVLLALLAPGLAFAEAMATGPFPGISGMAKLGDYAYLTVHDVKVTKDPASEGPRVGLLTLTPEGGAAHEAVEVDWSGLKGGRPNDLEAICAVEGQPGEFVAVESSYVGDDFARIIRLKATLEGGKAVVAPLGCVRFLPTLPDGAEFDNIEGAQTFTRDGVAYLLLAKRGKNEKKARLIWGVLNWEKPVFKVTEDYKVWTPFKDLTVPEDKRYASDLLIREGRIYIVSCNDPGNDGPFTSVVYHVGAIRTDGQLIHLIDSGQTEIVRYEGHKVEALAAAPGDGTGWWVAATDDEKYQGTVFITNRP